ncbi:MAG: hypothetical protein ACXVJW_11295 [Acidimicrobiia bacterium]
MVELVGKVDEVAPVAGVVSVGCPGWVWVVTGTLVDGVVLSPGFIRKISKAVSTTMPPDAPMALYSSERGRVGFQAVPVLRCAGLRRFVTSSGSYR